MKKKIEYPPLDYIYDDVVDADVNHKVNMVTS